MYIKNSSSPGFASPRGRNGHIRLGGRRRRRRAAARYRRAATRLVAAARRLAARQLPLRRVAQRHRARVYA